MTKGRGGGLGLGGGRARMGGTSMVSEKICPDCGGVIGGERTGADRPCRCPITMPATVSASMDTVDEREGETSGKKGKVCCQCGKSLEGHRRFKDSIGYWCKDCH